MYFIFTSLYHCKEHEGSDHYEKGCIMQKEIQSADSQNRVGIDLSTGGTAGRERV